MCVRCMLCVCVFARVFVCVCVCARACVRVCVRARARVNAYVGVCWNVDSGLGEFGHSPLLIDCFHGVMQRAHFSLRLYRRTTAKSWSGYGGRSNATAWSSATETPTSTACLRRNSPYTSTAPRVLAASNCKLVILQVNQAVHFTFVGRSDCVRDFV